MYAVFGQDQLKVVSLATQFYAALGNQYDVIFIPFVPSSKSPFGRFLSFLLKSKKNIISIEWSPLSKRTEQTYRAEDVRFFSDLGLKFVSWTKATDIFFESLIDESSYLKVENYFKHLIKRDSSKYLEGNRLAFVIDCNELFWSDDLLRFKCSNGYVQSVHHDLITKQRLLLEQLEKTVNHLALSKKWDRINIFVTTDRMNAELKNLHNDNQNILEISLLGPNSLIELANCHTIVLTEPVFGIEEFFNAKSLMDESIWPAHVRNAFFADISIFDAEANNGLLENCDETQTVYEHKNSFADAIKYIKTGPSKKFDLSIISQGYFLRLLLYALKNKLRKLIRK
jgi:hypothetical protein